MHTGAPECAHRAPRRHGERMNICQHDTKAPAPREGVGALTPDHQREGGTIHRRYAVRGMGWGRPKVTQPPKYDGRGEQLMEFESILHC